jgi:hypothetical protein
MEHLMEHPAHTCCRGGDATAFFRAFAFFMRVGKVPFIVPFITIAYCRLSGAKWNKLVKATF